MAVNEKDIVIKNKLSQKLEQYDLMDIAGTFLHNYDLAIVGIYPEILFDTMPDDTCFETLAAVKASMQSGRFQRCRGLLSDKEIKTLLSTPITTINNVIQTISELSEYQEDTIKKWYDRDIAMYFATQDQVKEVHNMLSTFFEEDITRLLYREAIILGTEAAQHRIELLLKATGRYASEVLFEMYGRNGNQGFLLFPYSYDPAPVLECLSNTFDPETTAHILKTDFWCLFITQKDSSDPSGFFHDSNLQGLINAYNEQAEFEAQLCEIFKAITPEDYDEVWTESFLPQYEARKASFIKYPISPRLMRKLCAVVTAFVRCGNESIITEEFKRFYIE